MGCIPTRIATRPDQDVTADRDRQNNVSGMVRTAGPADNTRRRSRPGAEVMSEGRTHTISSQTEDERVIKKGGGCVGPGLVRIPNAVGTISSDDGSGKGKVDGHVSSGHKRDSSNEISNTLNLTSNPSSPDLAHERLTDRRGTINAETQTSRSPCPPEKREHHWHVGSMVLLEKRMQVLLVFTKEDPQSDGFWWAAQRGNFKCDLVQNAETAVETYLCKFHDLVVIDRRQPCQNGFDSDTLCRSLRATKCNEHTIIMAVVKQSDDGNEPYTAHDLLRAGFNKRFMENSGTQVCLNELILIENESFMLRCKLGAVKTLFAALDQTSDSVDICSIDKEIQYVNKAFEKVTGYRADELINCSTKMYLPPGNVAALETAYAFLKRGKIWEGPSIIENKNGQSVWHRCISVPIMDLKGDLSQVVNIRTPIGQTNLEGHAHTIMESSAPELKNAEAILFRRRDSMRSLPRNFDMLSSTIANEASQINVRRPSLARIHSMTIEAPITKVINILTTAQQSSPITVSQALDRVLDILHSPELYSLQHAQLFGHTTSQHRAEEDRITSDLVGNLAGINMEHRPSKISMIRKHSSQQSSYELREVHPLLEIPDSVQALIERDANWDFPIFQLEKETHKRPLYYLGIKILQRFRVVEYLGCSDEVLHAWLQMIETGYKASNLYHNSTHAADVLQATAYFLDNPIIREVMEEHEIVGALLAAIIHDLDHPGRNSAFLCNAHNDLSILYNDKSVLESHHVALAFKLTLKNEQCNIFKNLDGQEFKALRRVIIDMVLATEMAKHFELLSRFLTFLDKSSTMVKSRCLSHNLRMNDGQSDQNRHTTTSSLGCDGDGSTYSQNSCSRRASAPNPLLDIVNSSTLSAHKSTICEEDPSTNSSSPSPSTKQMVNNSAGIIINFPPNIQAKASQEEEVFLSPTDKNDRRSPLSFVPSEGGDSFIGPTLGAGPAIAGSYSAATSWQETLIELLVGSENESAVADGSPAPSNRVSSDNQDNNLKHTTSGTASKNRALVLDMLIKCADVSNPCRPLDICKEWSKRIAEEYFEQTDEEKRLGLPVVMPTFDRRLCNIPQSQISFIDYFVTGMFEAWDSFCSVPDLMGNLHSNYIYWKELANEVKMKRMSSADVVTTGEKVEPTLDQTNDLTNTGS